MQYVGEWEHDKRHGRGRYTFKNGITNDRMWEIGEEQQKKADMTDIIDKIKKGGCGCGSVLFTAFNSPIVSAQARKLHDEIKSGKGGE